MKNNSNFTFTQIKNYIPDKIIKRTVEQYKSDYYTKKFTTKMHLLTIMKSVLSDCTSLREIVGLILLSSSELNKLGFNYLPKKSTIRDANMKRNPDVFKTIYFELLKRYRPILADSSNSKEDKYKDLTIVDSTTISLFSDISRGVGRNPKQGKKKGGLKLHTKINSMENVPNLVKITDATTNDRIIYKYLDNLQKGSIITFDKGYNDYTEYQKFNEKGIYFVTKQNTNARYKNIKELDLLEETPETILKDEIIEVKNGLRLRRVAYWYEKDKKTFEYITNNLELPAEDICQIYKKRWKIELLFKRLKQNYPLKYFLGDNRNAIEIQIWVTLIVDLILQVMRKEIKKNHAFSTIVSIIRLALMIKVDIIAYFNEQEKYSNTIAIKSNQLKLEFG